MCCNTFCHLEIHGSLSPPLSQRSWNNSEQGRGICVCQDRILSCHTFWLWWLQARFTATVVVLVSQELAPPAAIVKFIEGDEVVILRYVRHVHCAQVGILFVCLIFLCANICTWWWTATNRVLLQAVSSVFLASSNCSAYPLTPFQHYVCFPMILIPYCAPLHGHSQVNNEFVWSQPRSPP